MSVFFQRIFLALVFLEACFFLTGCVDHDIEVKINASDLVNAVNEVRQQGCQCGEEMLPPVPPLIWNEALETASYNHVVDMYTHQYFSHLSLDGTPPIIRAQRAGYQGTYVGENIARGYNTIDEVVGAWKNSESHCRAMMDTLYQEAGASVLHGYWVLDLGRP